jgi:uncharacterized protein with ATP-grasp and redox domains
MAVVAAMTDFLSERFDQDSVPSHIGTERDLLVQKMTGCDPYSDLKSESNTLALSLLPDLDRLLAESSSPDKRFRRATLIAAAANAIEFDVSGRAFTLNDLRGIVDKAEDELAIDQISQFEELCGRVHGVLYLMDNAGEIALDMMLIREIRRIGPKVIAVVKGGPVLNDATEEDANQVGLDKYVDKVITTGTAAIGVNLDRSSGDFVALFNSAELIVAKGMGSYESLTEFEPHCPIVHIMRTKCEPVARHVGVPLNKNVILIRAPQSIGRS